MRVTFIFLLSLILAACNAEPKASVAPQKKKKQAKTHLVEVVNATSVPSSTVSNWHGSLEYNELVNIYNQEKGRIDSFPFREGDRVKKGELLVHMDDRLLRAEKGRLLAQIVQAKSDWNRIKRLVNKQAISAEELEKARTQLAIYDAEKKIAGYSHRLLSDSCSFFRCCHRTFRQPRRCCFGTGASVNTQ